MYILVLCNTWWWRWCAGQGGGLSCSHAQQHAESTCIIFIYYLPAFLHARTRARI
jgi:hypothetical protein